MEGARHVLAHVRTWIGFGSVGMSDRKLRAGALSASHGRRGLAGRDKPVPYGALAR